MVVGARDGDSDGGAVGYPLGAKVGMAEGMRDGGYRSEEVIEQWKERDPIKQFRARLLTEGLAVEKDLSSIEDEVGAQTEEAYQFAKKSPYPAPETVADFIYSAEQEITE